MQSDFWQFPSENLIYEQRFKDLNINLKKKINFPKWPELIRMSKVEENILRPFSYSEFRKRKRHSPFEQTITIIDKDGCSTYVVLVL